MKTLYNNKGVALIILIIAMTLISFLGASMVSFMGAKQRGFLYQLDSYRALNLANAGVECAIRFTSDRDLFTNYSAYSYPNSAWTTFAPFGANKGTFSISYDFDYTNNNDILYIRGNYAGTTREVRLRRFRRYISALTIVPNTAETNLPDARIINLLPSQDIINPIIVIPLMNNDSSSKTINKIIIQTGSTTQKNLKKIRISDTTYNTEIYSGPDLPGTTYWDVTIAIVQPINITTNKDRVCKFELEFTAGDVLSAAQYTLTYYFTDGTTSIVTFTV